MNYMEHSDIPIKSFYKTYAVQCFLKTYVRYADMYLSEHKITSFLVQQLSLMLQKESFHKLSLFLSTAVKRETYLR